jgi:hypothetical protein
MSDTICKPTTTLSTMRTCQHCGIRYDFTKPNTSSLKLTWCSELCEGNDLRYSLKAFERLVLPGKADG